MKIQFKFLTKKNQQKKVDKHQEICYNFGDFLMVMVSRVWVGYISHINVISFDIVLELVWHVDFVKCVILKDGILSYLFIFRAKWCKWWSTQH